MDKRIKDITENAIQMYKAELISKIESLSTKQVTEEVKAPFGYMDVERTMVDRDKVVRIIQAIDD